MNFYFFVKWSWLTFTWILFWWDLNSNLIWAHYTLSKSPVKNARHYQMVLNIKLWVLYWRKVLESATNYSLFYATVSATSIASQSNSVPPVSWLKTALCGWCQLCIKNSYLLSWSCMLHRRLFLSQLLSYSSLIIWNSGHKFN